MLNKMNNKNDKINDKKFMNEDEIQIENKKFIYIYF